MNRPLSDKSTAPQKNHLLAALSTEVKERLLPHLELVCLSRNLVLHNAGDIVRQVYFPIDSLVSLVYEMEDGASADISMVGNDGVVGVAAFLGSDSASSHAIVHSAGSAYRLSGQRLKDECELGGGVLQLLLRYTQALMTQIAQTAVCNRHHSVDQQLCRWLLLALDRVSGNGLTMTHELIAGMLGVRRESVTDAASALQRLGVIEYYRGHIVVLDRNALEQRSCECYAAVRREAGRLQPYLKRDAALPISALGPAADPDFERHQPPAARRLFASSPQRAAA